MLAVWFASNVHSGGLTAETIHPITALSDVGISQDITQLSRKYPPPDPQLLKPHKTVPLTASPSSRAEAHVQPLRCQSDFKVTSDRYTLT